MENQETWGLGVEKWSWSRERKISPKFSCIKFFQIRDILTQIPATPCLKQQKKAICRKFLSGISQRLGPWCPRNILPKNLSLGCFSLPECQSSATSLVERTWGGGSMLVSSFCPRHSPQSLTFLRTFPRYFNQAEMNGATFSIKAPKEHSEKFVATLRRKFLTRGNVLRIFSVLRRFWGASIEKVLPLKLLWFNFRHHV